MFKKIHNTFHFILMKYLFFLGFFLINFAYYAALPYVIIYLKDLYKVNLFHIGLIMGVSPLLSCCASIFIGNKSDALGQKRILYYCLFGSIVAFILMSLSSSLLLFVSGYIAVGVFKGGIDTTFKAYLAAHCHDKVNAFGWRALSINVSAALGPLLGYLFVKNNNLHLFSYCALLQIGAFIFLLASLADETPQKNNKNIINNSIKYKFTYLILSIVFAVACYVQLDSTIPLYITQVTHNNTHIYTLLLIMNATCAIILQPLATKMIKIKKWFNAMKIGLVAFMLAFLIFALNYHIYWLMLAIIFFTVAELLVFQSAYVAIDELASHQNRGLYYGLANFDSLGLALGSFLGCWLFSILDHPQTFLVLCVILPLPGLWFLMKYQK